MLNIFKEKLNSIPETDMALERINRQDEILKRTLSTTYGNS